MNIDPTVGEGSGSGLSRRSVFKIGTAGLVAAGVGVGLSSCATDQKAISVSGKQTEASGATTEVNKQVYSELNFSDQEDFLNSDRGFVSKLADPVIKDSEGKIVWDGASYEFLTGPCPDSVNPSLWRQSQLNAKQGLYEVVPGIYQIRGLDLSNMTLIEGKTGVIVIDPLISVETAAAGLKLYRDQRGDRPVTGMIYTHSHADHFGGAAGVTTLADSLEGRCPVFAPAGFLEHAVAENIYAGTAMARRAAYMYGAALPKGPLGQVGVGLGQTTSVGKTTLIPPTVDIVRSGQEEIIDGVKIVFQLTPGTEAPAEMNFYFPEMRALCMAENISRTLHNILTLRGALVRDAHAWSSFLTESINDFARNSDVMFTSHHWPSWGTEEIVEYISLQRDLYAYLHDQTLRLLNQGYVGSEIAEMIQLPPAIENRWFNRGYYGTVSHNVKAIYQRYMGWFDGNPASLWAYPPVDSAKRHVDAMGGADNILAKAQEAYDDADYRWVAQLVNYVVFADPSNVTAKNLQASALEQLGYMSESGPWRNFYLSGAYELRNGTFGTPTQASSAEMLSALSVDQVFDAVSLRIVGNEAWDLVAVTDWVFADSGNLVHRTELRNGVLIHYPRRDPNADKLPSPDLTITLSRPALISALMTPGGLTSGLHTGEIRVDGDASSLTALSDVMDEPNTDFAIVTPT